MAKFISGIVAIVILVAIIVKVVALFSGGSSKSESMEFYFGNLAEMITVEEFDHATGTDGGEDVFFQFTASDKVIEDLLTKLKLKKFEQGISINTLRKGLYTLPEWFAPALSKDPINILYPDYYGMILVEGKRSIEDPEDSSQTIEESVFYFGAAGKHLKIKEED